MDCQHCIAINEPVLYRCLECYCDEEESDMCDECKIEHIDANFGNVLHWKIIYPTK